MPASHQNLKKSRNSGRFCNSPATPPSISVLAENKFSIGTSITLGWSRSGSGYSQVAEFSKTGDTTTCRGPPPLLIQSLTAKHTSLLL
jgi:hypothetical protein